MGTRGRDWSPLGRHDDPTPGDVGLIEYLVAGLHQLEGHATDVAERLAQTAHEVGGARWSGAARDAFLGAFGPVPTVVATEGDVHGQIAAALDGWAGELQGLQDEADALLARAEAAEAARDAAADALPGAHAAQRAARDALRDARRDDRDVAAAVRRWDRADARVAALDRQLGEHDTVLEALCSQADALAETHHEALAGVARSVRETVPPTIDLVEFGTAVSATAVDQALGVDAAGADGLFEADEVGALIAQTQAHLASGQHLEDPTVGHYVRLLEQVAADPVTAGEVLMALGEDEVTTLLLGLHMIGEYGHAEDYTEPAEALLALIAAGSTTSGGCEVLGGAAELPLIAAILTAVPDLDSGLLADVARRVLDEIDVVLVHLPNAYFPLLGYGGHVGVALNALAEDHDALNAFVNADPADAARILLGLPDEWGNAEAALAVLIGALSGGNAEARAAAAGVIETLASEGAGHLDIEIGLLAALTPHLPELIPNGLASNATISYEVFRDALGGLLDGVGADGATEISALVVGAAMLHAGRSVSGTADELLDNLPEELSDFLIPLQAAMEDAALSDAEQQEAMAAGFRTGVGVASALVSLLGPDPVSKIALRELSRAALGTVADAAVERLGEGAIEAPDVVREAEHITRQLVPVMLANDETVDTLVANGDVHVTGPHQVPAGVPGERVVVLEDGRWVVITEDAYENLRRDIRDALSAANN